MARSTFLRFTTFSLLSVCLVTLGSWGQPPQHNDDHFPIQPTLVDAVDIPGLLKRVETGDFVRLKAVDFDQLLAQARDAAKHKRAHPVLTEVRYRAKLLNDRLDENSLAGTAEWKIRRRPQHAATLPLPGLQLAIRQARWADGQEAELYAQPGMGLFLDVPTVADSTLNLEWSLRGIPDPGELRFIINVVPAAIASLDLELPASLTPYLLDEDALLNGPTPSDPSWNVWRIHFGGHARLEMVLRRNDRPPPLLINRLNTTVRLNDLDGTARFEYRVESASGGFTELRFQHDATLTTTGVTVNNLASWSTLHEDNDRKLLLVRLREPTRSASVVISTAMSVPRPPAVWTSPTLTCINSVLRSEQLHWLISDRVELQQWSPGGYRLTNAERLVDERTYAIDMEPLPPESGATPVAKPNAVVQRRSSADITATQQLSWTIAPQEQSLIATTRFAMRDGRTTTLNFRLPDHWQLDRVEFGNRELEHVRTGNNLLRLTLPRPPFPNEVVEIVLRLKRPTPALGARDSVPIPDIVPMGVRSRQGRCQLRVDQAWQVLWLGPSGLKQVDLTTNEIDLPFESEGPSGTIRWEPRYTRLRAEAHTQITATETTQLHTRLTAATTGGQIPILHLWTPSDVQEPWVWRDSTGRRIADAVRRPNERLAQLGPLTSTNVWSAVVAQVSRATSGHWWTVSVPITAARELTIESRYSALGKSPVLPLVWVQQADFSGHVVDSDHTIVQNYGDKSTPTIPINTPPEFLISPATFLGTVDDDGAVRVLFRCRILGWSQATLPVQWPADATLIAIRVAGLLTTAREQDGRLAIPMPNTTDWQTIEFDYRLPAMRTMRHLPHTAPIFAKAPPSVHHTWRISPQWFPFLQARWHRHPHHAPTLPLPDTLPIIEPIERLLTGQRQQTGTAPNRSALVHSLLAEYQRRTVIIDERALQPIASSSSIEYVTLELADFVLVTTPRELRSWREQAPIEANFSSDIEEAIQVARQHGRDASGRFVLLGQSTFPIQDMAWANVPLDWLILEQDDPTSTPLLFDRSTAYLLAWIVSVLPILLVCVSQHSRRRSLLLCLWLLLCLGGWLGGPTEWHDLIAPLLLAGLCAGILQTWSMRKRQLSSTANVPSTTVSLPALGSLCVLITLTGWLQSAESATKVFVVLGSNKQPTEYYVPGAFVERLKQTIALNVDRPTLVLTQAAYQGTVENSAMKMLATYRVVAHRDEPIRLRLPFGQVKLREVLLDGAPAGMIESKDNELLVHLRGRGAHSVQVQFTIPLLSSSNQEIRLGIPEVPNTRLQLEVAQPMHRVRPVGWRGAVQHGSTPKGESLTVDMGAAATLHVLWQSGNKETAPVVRVREASLWSINPGHATLRAALEYRIERGSLNELKIHVPSECAILNLDVRRDGSANTATSGVRDWTLGPNSGSYRPLTIQMNAPLTGRAVVHLELVPSNRLPLRSTLRAVQVPNVDTESYVALQVDPTCTLSDVSPTALTPHDTAVFISNIWTPLWGPFNEPLTSVYRVMGKENPQFTSTLRLQPTIKTVAHTIEWQIEPTRVVGQINSRWLAHDRTATVDWLIPANFDFVDLRANGLQRWTKNGNRVRLWLEKPVTELVIDWRISQPITLPIEGGTLALPSLGGSDATCTARLSVSAGLVAYVNPNEPFTDFTWQPPLNHVQRVRLLPAAHDLFATSETTLDAQRDVLVIQQRIQVNRGQNVRPQHLGIRVPNGAPSDTTVSVPPGWGNRVKGTGVGRTWEITIPAQPKTDDFIRVTTRLPMAGSERWSIPQAELRSGLHLVSFRNPTVTLAARELRFESLDGLQPLAPGYYAIRTNTWQSSLIRIGGAKATIIDGAALVTAIRVADEWHYRARYRLHIPPNTTAELLCGAVAVQSLWLNQQARTGTFSPTLRLDQTCSALELVWQSRQFDTQMPAFVFAGEPWQPTTQWEIIGAPEWTISGPALTTEPAPVVPEARANGPEWSRGVPYRFIHMDRMAPTLQFTQRIRQPWLLSQLVLVATCLLFVLLTAGSNVRFAPEQLSCLAVASIAYVGMVGLPLVVLVFVAWMWRLSDARHFFQRHQQPSSTEHRT